MFVVKIDTQTLSFAIVRVRVQAGELIVGDVVDLLFVAAGKATVRGFAIVIAVGKVCL